MSGPMRIGLALNINAENGKSDAASVRDQIALADLAEPLGFQSLFVLEHHFTGYCMSPVPFELLAFLAGRTEKMVLGTCVVVLPWHDPIRVAEQICFLDIVAEGRCLFAFGRGLSPTEYDGMRVAMEESRGRFREAAEIVIEAMCCDRFSYEGRYFRIPHLSIRPKSSGHPEERFYCSAMSDESRGVSVALGWGILVSTQKPWPELGSDIACWREAMTAAGHSPRGTIVQSMVSVAESRKDAEERAAKFMDSDLRLIADHYRFGEGHLSQMAGYESYSAVEEHFRRVADDELYRKDAVRRYQEVQIIGTPSDCIAGIRELASLTGPEHLVLEFSYGGMPHAEAEANMRLFAAAVLPSLA